MGRPPVEWPIPAYQIEIRERLVLVYRTAASVLRGLVPGAVTAETVGSEAALLLTLENHRLLRPVGAETVLASEYHVVQLLTPVRWRRACRPDVRGSFLLGLGTDRRGVGRLLERSLHLPADRIACRFTVCRDRAEWEVASSEGTVAAAIDRPVREESWPVRSLYPSQEDAEAALLHPEAVFVPDPGDGSVRAAPVHLYARSTLHVGADVPSVGWLAGCPGVRPEELRLDHALLQKRCTHTWAFPPERIPAAASPRVQLAPAG